MAVFGIVIFFWFSFHQNGLTLTMFAKDYTQLTIGGKAAPKADENTDVKTDDTVYGEMMQDNTIVHLVSKKVNDLSDDDMSKIANAEDRKSVEKMIAEKGLQNSASSTEAKQGKADKLENVYLFADSATQAKRYTALTTTAYKHHEEEVEEANNGGIKLSAEVFQSINPFVVVFLTPLIMLFFSALAKRGKEPSTPAKIAIGMGIAALAYVVMTVASIHLPSQASLNGSPVPEADKVTPMVLFGVYFILTVAELFISPLGLSFVSKVAPTHLQGLMQGCWLGATAVGNACLFLGALMYDTISLSATWGVFAIVCFISMGVMLAMVKWLERVTA
ncbi:MAG: hypothetical protein K2O00_01895 [Muribaculaceae bacterium]|nr:hypothetical protein [Muribaculaceae bacterium]